MYVYMYVYLFQKNVFLFRCITQARKSNKCLHFFYKIYIYTSTDKTTYILTCTKEEATKMAAKYLKNKLFLN